MVYSLLWPRPARGSSVSFVAQLPGLFIPPTAVDHERACWCGDAFWLKQVRMKVAHGVELPWSAVYRLLSGRAREKILLDFSFLNHRII